MKIILGRVHAARPLAILTFRLCNQCSQNWGLAIDLAKQNCVGVGGLCPSCPDVRPDAYGYTVLINVDC